MHGIFFTGYHRHTNMVMPTLGAYRLRSHLATVGYETTVADYIDHWTDDEIMSYIGRYANGLLFVGFSVTFMQLDRLPLLDRIRSTWPCLRIILGAQEPRLEHYVRSGRFTGRIDMLFMGFAEVALERYLDWLTGRSQVFQSSGEYMGQEYVISDRVHPYTRTDQLTVRWRDGDPASFVRALPLEISRGCIFRCRFCNHSLTGKSKVDYVRSEDDLADEIRRNHECFGIHDYLFADDTFNDSMQKLEIVRRAIDRSGVEVRFAAYLRYELVHRNPAQLGMLRDMGLHHASLGIESMNERTRKAIGKGLTNEELLDTLEMIRSAGITIHSGFIAGLPHDTREDLESANEWLISHGRSYLDSWFWSPLWIGNHVHMRSQFEMEAADHGYTVDPNDELSWVGPTMDSVMADTLSLEFNEKARFIRGPVGFEVMELLAMGLSLQSIRGLTEMQVHDLIDRELTVHRIAEEYKARRMVND